MLDELGDNRPKRAEMKMPHHRVAANGNSETSWRSMLIMLFKLVVTLEDVFKVWSSESERMEAQETGGVGWSEAALRVSEVRTRLRRMD